VPAESGVTYDALPDGWFIMLKSSGAPSGRRNIHLITN
jgi:hypothetical protein